jgi:uncharacterized membrane protein
MSGLLSNFRNTVVLSAILAVVMIVAFGMNNPSGFEGSFWQALFRWIHVAAGILWIGLLYYFNFVQIRKMPDIPAELKPAISKYIAPEALFWFRWAALVTVLAGIGILLIRGHEYASNVLSFGLAGGGVKTYALMGMGVYLALIMFLNVWGIIWPNQKRALGIVEATPEVKARAAKIAMLGSRTNLLLSLPMLTAMTMQQTLFG